MAEEKEKKTSKKWEKYEVEGDTLKYKNKTCPKCGPGVFLANHKDRFACGACGYMEKKSGAPETKPEPPKEEPKPEPEPPKEEPKEEAPAEEKPEEEKPPEEKPPEEAPKEEAPKEEAPKEEAAAEEPKE